jgi:predicted O-methyltransferase YrrM
MKTFKELLEEFKVVHVSLGMLEDVKLLYDYATGMKFQRILEFGVLHGNSTRTFASAASVTQNCHITSVDVEQGCIDEVSRKLKDDNLEKYVTFHKDNSIDFLLHQPNGAWDCIFIDTDHRFVQTVAELFLAGLKVKQTNGFIFMHDTNMGEVAQAIELFKSYVPCGHKHFNTPAGLDVIIIGGT